MKNTLPTGFKFYTSLSDVYIIYDKELIKNKSGTTNSKYLLVMGYLRKHMSSIGTVPLTINDLVSHCGYSILGGNRKNQNQFKEILKLMILENSIYLVDPINIDEISNNVMFNIGLSQENCFFYTKNYVVINLKEFETIINSNTTCNKNIILLVYLNIKKHIYNSGIHNSKSVSITLSTLESNCDLNLSTIKRAIEELISMKLLWSEIVFIKTEKNLIKRVVFALDDKGFVYGEKGLMDYYEVNKIYKSQGEIDNESKNKK